MRCGVEKKSRVWWIKFDSLFTIVARAVIGITSYCKRFAWAPYSLPSYKSAAHNHRQGKPTERLDKQINRICLLFGCLFRFTSQFWTFFIHRPSYFHNGSFEGNCLSANSSFGVRDVQFAKWTGRNPKRRQVCPFFCHCTAWKLLSSFLLFLKHPLASAFSFN